MLTFGGQRPGCLNNCISAGGLILMPEAQGHCQCALANQTSVALYHKESNLAWGAYGVGKELTPVKHIALNLGAPGDIRDEKGTLWIHCPNRVRKWNWLGGSFHKGPRSGYYFNEADVPRIEGDKGWVFACGGRGLKQLGVPLTEKGQSGTFTVRLYFAEPDGFGAGERVFNVSLQGTEVLRNFDIAGEAGGVLVPTCVRQFKGIKVAGSLAVRLTPSEGARVKLPVLCGIEVIDESYQGPIARADPSTSATVLP